MIRKLLLLPLLLAPAPLMAQGNVNEVPAGACTPANPPQGGRASFSTSADNVRILLCGGVKYLFTSNRGGSIRLELRPLTPGVQMPQLREGMMGTGVEGGRSWVVDVGTTGIFEVRVLGLDLLEGFRESRGRTIRLTSDVAGDLTELIPGG